LVWLALLAAGPLAAQDPAREGDGSTLEDLDWMVGDWVLVPDDEAKRPAWPKGGRANLT
jgi:hypothetical protein